MPGAVGELERVVDAAGSTAAVGVQTDGEVRRGARAGGRARPHPRRSRVVAVLDVDGRGGRGGRRFRRVARASAGREHRDECRHRESAQSAPIFRVRRDRRISHTPLLAFGNPNARGRIMRRGKRARSCGRSSPARIGLLLGARGRSRGARRSPRSHSFNSASDRGRSRHVTSVTPATSRCADVPLNSAPWTRASPRTAEFALQMSDC